MKVKQIIHILISRILPRVTEGKPVGVVRLVPTYQKFGLLPVSAQSHVALDKDLFHNGF